MGILGPPHVERRNLAITPGYIGPADGKLTINRTLRSTAA